MSGPYVVLITILKENACTVAETVPDITAQNCRILLSRFYAHAIFRGGHNFVYRLIMKLTFSLTG